MVLPIHIVIPIIIIIISSIRWCIFLNVVIDYMYCCPVCTCTFISIDISIELPAMCKRVWSVPSGRSSHN